MVSEPPDPGKAVGLPEFIALLGRLRVWAGSPSFRALARRVGPLLDPPQTVAQSTIGDVFQTRRRRLDLDLVVAVVRALGLDEADVARWRDVCVAIHDTAGSGGPTGVFRQLPSELATFTGRERELGEITAAIDAGPDSGGTVVISAIEGMGGVGKTQLALHVAHRLVRAGRFPDAQLYVNLRGFDPEQAPADPAAVLDGFLRALGVPAQRIPAGLDERAAMFRDQVHSKRVLVLLDNASEEAQVRPLIPAGPGVFVVITSRRTLAALNNTTVHLLDVLDVGQAVELLAATCGADRVGAEPRAAERIAVLCGGLPLALALSAARLRSRPGWSLATMADRLGQGLPTLAVGGTDIRRVFAMSYGALPDAAKTVFRLLGLHPGPEYTAWSVAALADLPVARAQAILELLQDESLLRQRTAGRYEMHDLLRHYVLELGDTLEPEAQDAARARLIEHYVHSAYRAAMKQYPDRDPLVLPLHPPTGVIAPIADADAAHQWFDEELDTVRALIVEAVGRAPKAAWHLAWALVGHCMMTGRSRDQINVQTLAISAAEAVGHLPAQAFSWHIRGVAETHIRHLDAAEADLRHAIGLYQRIGDATHEARACAELVKVYGHRRERLTCVKLARHALALSRACGDQVTEAQSLNMIGWHQAHIGALDLAATACAQSLALFEEIDDKWGQSTALDSLAFVYRRQGDLHQAIATYQRSLDLHGPRSYFRAETLHNLGDTYLLAGRPDLAREALEQAFGTMQEHSHPRADDVKASIDALADGMT